MSTEETIEILYNSCYGGWGPSDKAIQLYNMEMKQIDPNFTEITSYQLYNIYRHDKILVQIYYKMGEEFDRKYSKTKVKTILKKYKDYYDIDEYDGLEEIIINNIEYEMDELQNKIKSILKNDMTNDEKINELNKLIFR